MQHKKGIEPMSTGILTLVCIFFVALVLNAATRNNKR